MNAHASIELENYLKVRKLPSEQIQSAHAKPALRNLVPSQSSVHLLGAKVTYYVTCWVLYNLVSPDPCVSGCFRALHNMWSDNMTDTRSIVYSITSLCLYSVWLTAPQDPLPVSEYRALEYRVHEGFHIWLRFVSMVVVWKVLSTHTCTYQPGLRHWFPLNSVWQFFNFFFWGGGWNWVKNDWNQAFTLKNTYVEKRKDSSRRDWFLGGPWLYQENR